MASKRTLIKSGLLSGAIAASFFAASCSISPSIQLMDVQKNDVFALQHPIDIPAGKAKTFIQFGKVTDRSFDRREQHCRIEIYALQPQKTTIHPDQFTVSRVQIGDEQIAQQSLPAGISPQIPFAFVGNAAAQGDYQPPETMDYVHLYLRSERQPNVLRLTCAGALSNGDPLDSPRSHRPQRQQINQILGKLGSI